MHDRWMRKSGIGIVLVASSAAGAWLGGCAESETPDPVGYGRGGQAQAGQGPASGGSEAESGGWTSSGGYTLQGGASSGGTVASSGGSAQGGSSMGGRGGSDGTGGATTGGVSTMGGANATGGAPSSGGSTVTGGASSKGGSTASGGAATGGSKSSGGAPSSGGASATGGAPSTGGTSATANLFQSSDFEGSSVDGWKSRGTSLLTVTAEDHHSGSQSLKVTGRTANWHGAEYDVKSVITPGETYDVTVWARPVAGSPSSEFKLTRELVGNSSCGSSQFEWIKTAAGVTDASWIELSGTLSIPSDCVPTKLSVYVESTGETVSYYMDDTSLQLSK